ncbi:hypothetical protein VTJ49DRAFT_4361 [Mycothermus thermophilus]|uniref:Life-span regulatory factor domain-containing protein n=1 Tax=Humicola insolens TaxID=85995 RepID=A0ABR3VLG0_HUMIN
MHHHRRRSGHASGNTSFTDVRKAVTATDLSGKRNGPRSPTMTKKTALQSSSKQRRSTRDRERDEDDDGWWDDERESFPAYCMVCDKQFTSQDEGSLYCSSACRSKDQDGSAILAAPSRYSSTHHSTPQYPVYSAPPEPRDIIPRASPSRPSSMHISPPATPTSAISALKSLSIRPASPSSPVGTYQSSLWPFARSVTTATPHRSSFANQPPPPLYSSTYDGTYYAMNSDYYGSSSDRPLPSRRPATYSRPKSIELVTPMLGR